MDNRGRLFFSRSMGRTSMCGICVIEGGAFFADGILGETSLVSLRLLSLFRDR